MLFNSLDFAIFLPIVFAIYWLLGSKNIRAQNMLLVLASYFFYGYWDWRFLSLILFSTVIDYTIGLQLTTSANSITRKFLLWISLSVNLGLLGFFKYYNFFLDNFKTAFTFFGSEINADSLEIILPIGISFYTFQTISYTIDIYRRKLESAKDFIAFSAFVSFFPQLVAGPIERAINLLPQFHKRRQFNYLKATDGLRQILWGLFKKIVIADNCAHYANIIFNNSDGASGSTLLLGAIFFTFQIYGDFSGYSDIAIGTSRLFGFNLMRNFAFPYFSRDIAEFWRRWHISLSTWFRDYVYIPLGGSRGGIWMQIRNVFIIFLVSGFWHGANWTFIVWGGLNALYFLPLLLLKQNRKNIDIVANDSILPSLKELKGIIVTFSLTILAWIFFRSENMAHAIQIITEIFSSSFFSYPKFHEDEFVKPIFALILFFLLIEWLGRRDEHALEKLIKRWIKPCRYVFYYVLIALIFWFSGNKQEFIYFQF